MFSSRDKSLFSKYSLDGYLRQVKSSMNKEIRSLSFQKIKEDGEEKLIDTLLEKYNVVAPSLLEDKIEVDAKEQEIVIDNGNSRFFNDGPIKRTGLFITATIPYEGLGDLFKCQPSTHTFSGTPNADIEDNVLVLCYKTIEKDTEKIKSLWQKDIQDIKQNLEWITRDTLNHNNSLKSEIKTMLTSRKKEAGESQDLISKITT